jgi:hypothetical protein
LFDSLDLLLCSLLAEDSRQNAFTLIVAAYAERDSARYPVDASELLESRMTIRVYQAQDHLPDNW